MTHFIVFASVLASLLMYLLVAKRANRIAIGTPDDYFLARQSGGSAQFGAAQTAYALQMATVYPFFSWAISGQWWIAVINTAFYAAGIALFNALLPRFGAHAIGILGSSTTIHSAIAKLHDAPHLRQLTAWMSIIAFCGLAAFEIVWGASVFRALFDGSNYVYYLSITLLAAYLLTYVWIGGQRAAIRADQYQLLFAYVGLHALAAWVAWHPKVQFQRMEFQLVAPLIVIASAYMLWRRSRMLSDDSAPRFLRNLNILTMVSLTVLLVSLFYDPSQLDPSINLSGIAKLPSTPQFWLIAISVSSLPLFFQFVDMTNWQRLTLLNAKPSDFIREAKKGLAQYLLESPLSWLLPVFIGMGVAQFIAFGGKVDPWDQLLSSILAQPGLGGMVLAVATFVAIVAIFMSTADGLLTAVGYAYSYDVNRSSRAALDDGPSRVDVFNPETVSMIVDRGRIAIVLGTAVVVGMFIAIDSQSAGDGQKLIGLFLAFYAPMISMSPALIVPAVFGRRASPSWATWSLVVGMLVGLVCGVISVLAPDLQQGAFYWLSSPAALLSSWLIYLVGARFRLNAALDE